VACFWATSAKAFSALLALASAALVALSAEVLAASTSLRALEVVFSLASKEATRARASTRATKNKEMIKKIQTTGNQYRNVT
jgi:hypothetical protein